MEERKVIECGGEAKEKAVWPGQKVVTSSFGTNDRTSPKGQKLLNSEREERERVRTCNSNR